MTDLSILIPAKNEEFLGRTIQDLLENIEGNTEIIAVLDGYRPDPRLSGNDPRVTVIYNPQSVGQRAATNQAAKLAKGKYLMKIDAHCAFDKGFDVKMMADMQPDWTMVPVMKNLHAFDWVCPDGHRRYQSPSGVCNFININGKWIEKDDRNGEHRKYKICGKPTVKDIIWQGKGSPNSTSYRFDRNMHFQYWGEWAKSQEGDLTETLSLQGSCFMCTREKYFELDLCSEEFYSWGQQGVEVACKTWLSGGKVICNHKTWYAHMFRTRGGDFGFPYHQDNKKVDANRQLSRELFQHNKWPKAKYKFQWLLDKFHPPEWELTKGIIYYTHNTLEGTKLIEECRTRLNKIAKDKHMTITVGTNEKINFGNKIIRFPHHSGKDSGAVNIFRKIVACLEHSSADIVYFTEHDVLYDPSHFDYTPPLENRDSEIYYYNTNVWQLRMTDGHCIYYHCRKLSQLCCFRLTALEHFKKKLAKAEADPVPGHFDRAIGFEPGTRRINSGGVDNSTHNDFQSPVPNIDIRHETNFTASKWDLGDFRNSKYRNDAAATWQEGDSVPGWGKGIDLVKLLQ